MEFVIEMFPEYKFNLILLDNINSDLIPERIDNLVILNPEYVSEL